MPNGISNLIIKSENLRNTLLTRNLYTPTDEYSANNGIGASNTISAISSIVGAVTPFQSINIENSALGRLIDSSHQTPLSQIGLMMLGKQLAYNVASSSAQQFLPSINLNSIVNGGKLFQLHKDLRITKNENGGFMDMVERITGFYPTKKNPFNDKSDNTTYINNTTDGQLDFLINSINQNVYKTSDPTLKLRGSSIKNPIHDRKNLINIENKKFFIFDDIRFYPYNDSNLNTSSSLYSTFNENMINATNNIVDSNQEYGGNKIFVNNLGKPTKSNDVNIYTQNTWLDDEKIDSNNVLWGRDGVDKSTNNSSIEFRGNYNIEKTPNIIADDKFDEKFGVKGAGLLEYTRNLINAKEGSVGDLTKKAFKEDDGSFGFNGSGLWKSNNSNYANSTKSEIKNSTGVRQHTRLDPYDRFAKAIRFDGNILYNGNVDSVIYNTVKPRIHPTRNEKDEINNKNLMFSIENLAVSVNKEGMVDDEYGTVIPKSEVGQSGGRIMWFPPYAMEIQETATAKYESTVMVGRNEPMYNYQNSERTAVLNFTLLIDYPPHVSGYNSPREISEFFEFGGEPLGNKVSINNLEKQIEILKKRKKDIENVIPYVFNTPKVFSKTTIYFPNDIPSLDYDPYSVIDEIYWGSYDISSEVKNEYDNTWYGLNSPIYVKKNFTSYITPEGLSKQKLILPKTYSQYNSINTYDDFGNCALNNILYELGTIPKEERKYYEIYINGYCSQLWKTDYNKLLGIRRALTAKALISSRLKELFNEISDLDSYNLMGFNVIIDSFGESGADDKGDTPEGIPELVVKTDRRAEIEIRRSSEGNEKKKDDKYNKDVDELNKQISEKEKLLNEQKTPKNDTTFNNIFNERKEFKSELKHGFNDIKDNYYAPIFHSQTPEDFHKRLTFLQQCVRQGSAVTYKSVTDNTNVLKARNSVFGRQPICILRVGDFFFTKVVIESVNVDYTETTWDMNPEGFGMQPMLAKVTLNMKVIGGQSLKGPIDALQNAVSYNYYANSTYTANGRYILPSAMAEMQVAYKTGVHTVEGDAIINQFKSNSATQLEKLKQKH